ncbi:hypothetical protein RvY_09058 [Ramazzottius varieornatus]|uniref:HAT C-terminal dimerisation domain-containing protein n=1 Tax=Ramazzottius varieornatus TaxID=947166 RepID=A0A1D1VH76_RAMVA|nr:hypothetical protein RvY_09058 [Ramazzottius varieornatus]
MDSWTISYVIPAKIITGAADGDVFKSTVRLYRNDLKSVDLNIFKIDYNNWVCLSAQTQSAVIPADVVSTLRIMIENELDLIFPNIYRLLQIYTVVPATSCTAERTYLRTRMKNDRLTFLTLIMVHKDFIVDHQDVVSRFLGKRMKRRISATL